MQTLICLQLCQVSDQLYHMLATKIRIPALQKPWWCLLQVTAYLDGFHAPFRNLKAVRSEHPDWVKYFYWLFRLPERGGKQGGSNIVLPPRGRSARQQGEALSKSWRIGKPTTGKWTSHTDHCLEWLKYCLQEQGNFSQTVLRQHDSDFRKLQLRHFINVGKIRPLLN